MNQELLRRGFIRIHDLLNQWSEDPDITQVAGFWKYANCIACFFVGIYNDELDEEYVTYVEKGAHDFNSRLAAGTMNPRNRTTAPALLRRSFDATHSLLGHWSKHHEVAGTEQFREFAECLSDVFFKIGRDTLSEELVTQLEEITARFHRQMDPQYDIPFIN